MRSTASVPAGVQALWVRIAHNGDGRLDLAEMELLLSTAGTGRQKQVIESVMSAVGQDDILPAGKFRTDGSGQLVGWRLEEGSAGLFRVQTQDEHNFLEVRSGAGCLSTTCDVMETWERVELLLAARAYGRRAGARPPNVPRVVLSFLDSDGGQTGKALSVPFDSNERWHTVLREARVPDAASRCMVRIYSTPISGRLDLAALSLVPRIDVSSVLPQGSPGANILLEAAPLRPGRDGEPVGWQIGDTPGGRVSVRTEAGRRYMRLPEGHVVLDVEKPLMPSWRTFRYRFDARATPTYQGWMRASVQFAMVGRSRGVVGWEQTVALGGDWRTVETDIPIPGGAEKVGVHFRRVGSGNVDIADIRLVPNRGEGSFRLHPPEGQILLTPQQAASVVEEIMRQRAESEQADPGLRISVKIEDGEQHVHLGDPNGSVARIHVPVSLQPSRDRLWIGCRVRLSGWTPPRKGWPACPAVRVSFQDADQEPVGERQTIIDVHYNCAWEPAHKTVDVPQGATTALFGAVHARSGTLDVADLQVVSVEQGD